MYKIQPIERLIQIDDLVAVYDYVRPKGFYFPGESHDFWECVYIHEGVVTATADERVYQLDAGKLLIHKPMEFHRIWASEDCAPWVINISFHAHGVLCRQLYDRCFDLSPEQQEQFLKIVEIFTSLDVLKTQNETRKYRSNLNLIATLLESFLLNLSDNKEYAAHNQLPNDERYSKIVQIMQNNREKNLSLSELANLCQMSVSNMKRIFRMYSDVGIAKYYLTLRMRYAMELLSSGMSISAVSDALHFSDATYFYTVFKRETGVTPSQYRREKRNHKT